MVRQTQESTTTEESLNRSDFLRTEKEGSVSSTPSSKGSLKQLKFKWRVQCLRKQKSTPSTWANQKLVISIKTTSLMDLKDDEKVNVKTESVLRTTKSTLSLTHVVETFLGH